MTAMQSAALFAVKRLGVYLAIGVVLVVIMLGFATNGFTHWPSVWDRVKLQIWVQTTEPTDPDYYAT